MTEQEKKLWSAYSRSRSTADRNVLIEYYAPLARDLAANMRERLGRHVSIEDLQSDANLAIIEAIERYVPERANFKTFAYQIVHYRILDVVRVRDDAGRLCRERSKKVVAARNRFYHEHGRRPISEEELLPVLGISQYKLAVWKKSGHTHAPSSYSLNSLTTEDYNGNDIPYELKNLQSTVADPASSIEMNIDVETFLSRCDAKERLYLELHFYLGWCPWVIAKRLRTSVYKVNHAMRDGIAKLRGEAFRDGIGLIKARQAAEKGGSLC